MTPANKHKVTAKVAMEVAAHEAVIRSTYVDSVGVNTWSVGLTSMTGHNVDRYIRKPQPMQKCMDIYVWALRNYAEQVKEAFGDTPLSEAQFAAACSFHWNTGRIKRANWVNLYKSGNVAGARKAIMNFGTPKSIIGRRKKERDLFFDGKWSGNGKMAEYTRLTKSRSPVWSSRVTVDVSKELAKAFKTTGIKEDMPKQPDAPVTVPTISPTPPSNKVPIAGAGGILAALIAALAKFFGG